MATTLRDVADAMDPFGFAAPHPLGLHPSDVPDGDLAGTLDLPEIPTFDYEIPDETEADEWEQRVGIPAHHAYDNLLRQIDRKMAPLSTLFRGAQNTTADSMRKQHRAWIAGLILESNRLGEKVSEAALERTANADPSHLRYCAAMRRLEDAYHRLWGDKATIERRLAERDHRINVYRDELRNTR